MKVESRRDGSVVTITLDRPDKLNAMTDPMWNSLNEHLGVATDPSVSVIVLRGAGGNFCAGSDVTTLVGDEPLDERMRVSNRCVLAVHESPVPTIAVVDGVAAGAGANLALACDLVVVTPRARIIEVFIRRGLTLDSGASWLLPRLIGAHRARELAFLGDVVDGRRAAQWGLANWCVDAEELDGFVASVTARLAAASGAALATSKRLLRAGDATDLATALEAEIDAQLAVIAGEQTRARIAQFDSREREAPQP